MNSTLVNGLHLLQVLADAPHPHSVSDLSRQTGLPKSHIHRLLQTLVESQYVEKDSDRRYVIGVGAFRLGHALLRDIPMRRMYLPLMVSVVDRCNLPCTLALPFGSQAISVAHVFHDGEIRNSSETLGTVLPARTSALGKLFLSHQPAAALDGILQGLDYSPKGPRCHRNAKSLRTELNRIRSTGVSINNEEGSKGQASIAVPIFKTDGSLWAGIGLSGSVETVLGNHLEQHFQLLQSICTPPLKEPAA
ncbi:IclR family transcriptional regulator [Kiritimatiellaeota bacterium B1221]|nr:IclR family transcriptional regulator [Kiritimatiellaeota bacterium B1221]